MFFFLYEIFLFFAFVFYSPLFFYKYVFKKQYRRSFLKRWGYDFPKIIKGKGPLIWVHAVSVGETLAVSSLVKRIKNQWSESTIVFSSITETGHDAACLNIPQADYHVFFPFDFSFILRRILHSFSPDLYILSETDFWPNFQKRIKEKGGKIILINGKLSKSSRDHFSRFYFLSKCFFDSIDFFCLQSAFYQMRFESLGIPSEKILVTGNTKLDVPHLAMDVYEKQKWLDAFNIREGDFVITLGSTHAPEEKLLLQELKTLWQSFPHIKIFLVPRHPERFSSVNKILEYEGIGCALFSQKESYRGKDKVILIDSMGQLKKCYELSDLAIVCGSYTSKVGGHNIFEPMYCETATFFGPHMQTQKEAKELALEFQAARLVELKALQENIKQLITSPCLKQSLAKKGKELCEQFQGASERSWNLIEEKMRSFKK